MTSNEVSGKLSRNRRELADWMKRNAPNAAELVTRDQHMNQLGFWRKRIVVLDPVSGQPSRRLSYWSITAWIAGVATPWSPPPDGIPDDSPPFSA